MSQSQDLVRSKDLKNLASQFGKIITIIIINIISINIIIIIIIVFVDYYYYYCYCNLPTLHRNETKIQKFWFYSFYKCIRNSHKHIVTLTQTQT